MITKEEAEAIWAENEKERQETRDLIAGRIKEAFVCCICGSLEKGYGNNPSPIKEKGRCCDKCNIKVIKKRMEVIKNGKHI